MYTLHIIYDRALIDQYDTFPVGAHQELLEGECNPNGRTYEVLVDLGDSSHLTFEQADHVMSYFVVNWFVTEREGAHASARG